MLDAGPPTREPHQGRAEIRVMVAASAHDVGRFVQDVGERGGGTVERDCPGDRLEGGRAAGTAPAELDDRNIDVLMGADLRDRLDDLRPLEHARGVVELGDVLAGIDERLFP